MRREFHVRFYESGGVQFPSATRPTLPLQDDDPLRRKTFKAKLWVYAKDNRHGPPVIAYEFSKRRLRDQPLTVPADYQGYLQADGYPGYDPLFLSGKIIEVACTRTRGASSSRLRICSKLPGDRTKRWPSTSRSSTSSDRSSI